MVLSQLLHSAWRHQVAPWEVQCQTQLHVHAENLGALSHWSLVGRTDSLEDGEREAPVQHTTQTDHKPVCGMKISSKWVSPHHDPRELCDEKPKGLRLWEPDCSESVPKGFYTNITQEHPSIIPGQLKATLDISGGRRLLKGLLSPIALWSKLEFSCLLSMISIKHAWIYVI